MTTSECTRSFHRLCIDRLNFPGIHVGQTNTGHLILKKMNLLFFIHPFNLFSLSSFHNEPSTMWHLWKSWVFLTSWWRKGTNGMFFSTQYNEDFVEDVLRLKSYEIFSYVCISFSPAIWLLMSKCLFSLWELPNLQIKYRLCVNY